MEKLPKSPRFKIFKDRTVDAVAKEMITIVPK
jgi:hypothetical protein